MKQVWSDAREQHFPTRLNFGSTCLGDDPDLNVNFQLGRDSGASFGREIKRAA